jgi:hypothetical protein
MLYHWKQTDVFLPYFIIGSSTMIIQKSKKRQISFGFVIHEILNINTQAGKSHSMEKF